MRRRWDLLAVAGIVLALLVFLVGDNIVGRMLGGANPPTPQQRMESPAEPAVEKNATESTQDIQNHPTLIGLICAARSFTVSFDAHASDPIRYRRRSGATIVSIVSCNEELREFGTGDGLTTRGIVAGDRVEFEYSYLDGEGAPRCKVRARQVERNRLEGTIYCEATGASMETRRAIVQID